MLLECLLVCQISDLLYFPHHIPALASKLPVTLQVLLFGLMSSKLAANWPAFQDYQNLLIYSFRCQALKMMLLSCEREGWTLRVSGDIAALLGTGF